jgi:hypothetical protein
MSRAPLSERMRSSDRVELVERRHDQNPLGPLRTVDKDGNIILMCGMK